MLRAFFFLLSFFTDYQTLIDIVHIALILGLVNVGVLSCFGIRFRVRHSLAKRITGYLPGLNKRVLSDIKLKQNESCEKSSK